MERAINCLLSMMPLTFFYVLSHRFLIGNILVSKTNHYYHPFQQTYRLQVCTTGLPLLSSRQLVRI